MRLSYIDIAKGITIMLMVIGHSSIPRPLSGWIWSFHMPLFFLVSGITTHWERKSGIFVKEKSKGLLKPFFFYSLINILLFPLWKGGLWGENILHILRYGWEGCALWFIPVLYLSLLIVKAVPNGKAAQAGAAIVFSLVGILLCYYHINLPWTLSTVPMAAMYVLLGRIMSQWTKRVYGTNSSFHKMFLCMTICLSVQLPLSQFFHLDMAWNHILPFFPILIASFAGCYFILTLSRILSSTRPIRKILSAIGLHTLEILALSQCFIAILNKQIPSLGPAKYILLIIFLTGFVQIKNFYKQRFPSLPL